MNPRLGMIVAGVLLGVGVLALVTGLVANSRSDPDMVTWGRDVFLVKRRDLGQAMEIDFVRRDDGIVAQSIAGRTDLLCEPPHLMLVDREGDGTREVYFTTCDEGGFVIYRGGGQLEVEQLGELEATELPVLRSFWFRQIRDGGWPLIAVGMAALLVVGGGLGSTALFSLFYRRRAR